MYSFCYVFELFFFILTGNVIHTSRLRLQMYTCFLLSLLNASSSYRGNFGHSQKKFRNAAMSYGVAVI